MNYRKLFIILLLVLAAAARLPAVPSYPETELQVIYASPAFRQFCETVLGSSPEKEIERSFGELSGWLQSAGHDRDAAGIAAARAAMMLGRHFADQEDTQKARRLFSESLALLERITNERYRVERLLVEGEIYGHIFTMNPARNLFSYGRRSHDAVQQVWELDRDNPRSIILKSNQLLNTPKLFGGDAKRAEKLLTELRGIELLPVDEYTLYITLGQVELERRRSADARAFFRKAAAVYPGSSYVRDLIEQTY